MRLDAVWNLHETHPRPGLYGGYKGVGRGLSGSFDVTPLTGKTFIPRPPQSEIPPPVEQASSQDPAPVIPSESAPPPSSETPPPNLKSPQNIESKAPSPEYHLSPWLFQSLVIALLVGILVQIKRSKK